MLVPPDMIGAQSKMIYQMNKYCSDRVQARKANIHKTIQEVCRVVQDVLKEVEVQEPRFISSLNDYNGRFDGLEVISPTEFEIIIYLNQMGVLNFVDDGTLPGCAVLKLSDGRKRSMSLWVEFITASGYLSARKIRSRFQTLVAQACDKCAYRDSVKMIADTTEVKLRIRERIIVQITPAFKCAGLWPRSASHWPLPQIPWPHPNIVTEVKTEGFDMLSKECIALQGKNSAMEGDAWVLSFIEAENKLLQGKLSGLPHPLVLIHQLMIYLSRFPSRWMPEKMSEHIEDTPRSAFGSAGQSSHILCDEDTTPLRMRETSPRNGMG